MRISQIISERFINAVRNDPKSQAIKQKYKDQVWDLLQKSYAPIGGIKGSGFANVDDMVNRIPMWKMAVRDGRVRAVILYKDSGGRKSVAIGTDGTDEGARFLDEMFQQELTRSYSEKSKAALGKLMKLIPWSTLEKYLMTPDRVAELRPEDRIIPVTDVDPEDLPTDARITLTKYPQLKGFGYLRDLGGVLTFKVMSGTPNLEIK